MCYRAFQSVSLTYAKQSPNNLSQVHRYLGKKGCFSHKNFVTYMTGLLLNSIEW